MLKNEIVSTMLVSLGAYIVVIYLEYREKSGDGCKEKRALKFLKTSRENRTAIEIRTTLLRENEFIASERPHGGLNQYLILFIAVFNEVTKSRQKEQSKWIDIYRDHILIEHERKPKKQRGNRVVHSTYMILLSSVQDYFLVVPSCQTNLADTFCTRLADFNL
ncbi:hypothetical protein DICVIV_04708 [Dictyocaulus viviparus]|uniref:Uncharacterized protein n=1 Tax=Dictyocaulus viviparus TaxID=29172 RepID=A0A0D8XXB8_DICVI|nr:hypothetical protein DICVIV_04708 [Dictyocaulus viviparus]